MLNRLSIKLPLLFVGIALVSVGVIAVWVNRSVQIEFSHYYQTICQVQIAPGSTSTIIVPGNGANPEMSPYMDEAERDFLDAVRNSLWLAALVAILTGVALGYFFSRLISGPMKQLTVAARKVATGDFSHRVSTSTEDEIGEVSVAFNVMSEQLETKEKSRRQLLADIVHELRNPLSIIQGNLEVTCPQGFLKTCVNSGKSPSNNPFIRLMILVLSLTNR
jgi:signal transduction histidine kinase